MKYKILSAETTDGLEDLVNLALAEGWTVGGGFLYVPAKGVRENSRFYQAMTKGEAKWSVTAGEIARSETVDTPTPKKAGKK